MMGTRLLIGKWPRCMAARATTVLLVLACAGCGSGSSVVAPSDEGKLNVTVDGSDEAFTAVNATKQLKVSHWGAGFDDDVTGKAAFSSDAPGIVSVNASGLATAKARGSALITATYKGQTAAIRLAVYLIADLTGTWRVEFDQLSGEYGSMTWVLSQSGVSASGTFSNFRSDNFLTSDKRPASGSISGTLSGSFGKQTFTWRVSAPQLPAWPDCGEYSLSGQILDIPGERLPTALSGIVTRSSWCGVPNIQTGTIRITKQ
jgi:hypothetical protein